MHRFCAVPYEDQAELNLSPMLDVVFIMLIFFIVTASFIKEKAIPVALPSGLGDGPPVEEIRVVVEPGGSYFINGRILSAAGVSSYVRALVAENPDAKYLVEVSEGSVVRDAAVALDAGRLIGLDVVPIVADRDTR